MILTFSNYIWAFSSMRAAPVLLALPVLPKLNYLVIKSDNHNIIIELFMEGERKWGKVFLQLEKKSKLKHPVNQ
ncbi:hypothetical protein AM1BK_02420 [Neobacillus kokaensis]|uniref:Uncharacterized protein n=1 Tax=Neobacillus kokaensis TaxID=2759023 RepID=A0ABQ3MWS5_9BACI|nr:hypothetical protein AM1BK_02420 [Neobacillus kokaensis]